MDSEFSQLRSSQLLSPYGLENLNGCVS